MFRPGTHIVSEIAYCALHVRTINDLMRDLKGELERSEITPFNETTGKGQLRYLSVRGHHQSADILITFVVTEPLKKPLRKIVDNLRESGHKIAGAHMNLNSESGNAIFGPTTEKVWGADRMHETLCELDFGVSPTSFFQVNPWQAERIYRRVEQIAGLPKGDEVAWDLYCGIGQFSLVLARLGYRVLGAEENPAAIADADGNAARNDLIQPRPTFVASRIEAYKDKFPAWAQKPSLIVANPSRRGIAPEVRTLLGQVVKDQPGSRLIYVSCEIETLVRDLQDLKKAGLRLRQLEAFDMFPYTEKLEWLAVVTS